MAGAEITTATIPLAAYRLDLNSDGSLTLAPYRITVTVTNNILTFTGSHAIIKTIVTVFSLENKVTVLQSVK